MQWQTSPFAPALLLTTIVCLVVAAIIGTKRPARGVMSLALLAILTAWWAFFYALELLSGELAQALLFAKLQYLAISSIPLLLFLFVVDYFLRLRLPAIALAALAAIPVFTVVMVFSNEWHQQFWSRALLDHGLELSYGWAFWLYWAYANMVLLAGTGILAWLVLRYAERYRGQVSMLLVAALAPWAGNALYVTGIYDPIDLSPFGFAVAALALIWGLFRYHLLDIVPIARNLIFNTMTDSIVITDRYGRIIDVNPAALELIQMSEAEIIGKTSAEVFADQQNTIAHFADLEKSYNETMPIDGRVLNIQVLPLRQGKQITGRLTVLRDITQAHGDQRRLKQALTAAEAANKAKTEFLANTSHELRTPLTAILGFSELLRTGILGDIPNNQRHYLDQIHSSGEELLTIINDLLSVARLESGKVTIERLPFNIATLISDIASHRPNSLSGYTVPFDVQLGDDLGIFVGDPEKVYDVVVQLLENAFKFTPQGHVILRVVRDDDDLVIKVCDTGIGISQEALEEVFNPFFQADSSSTRVFGGNGVGLTICRHYVAAMGGTIEVSSHPGKGSEFVVRLPYLAT